MAVAPILLRMVASSVSLAASAGQHIRRIMKTGHLEVIDKGINDPQTEADRVAQQHIIGSLIRQYPKATIIGEEDLDPNDISPELFSSDASEDVLKLKCHEKIHSIKEEDVVVWVDPLDGTREFAQGFTDHVTVLIGFAFEGKPIAGIIHQPYYKNSESRLGRTLYGIVGIGTYGFAHTTPPNDRCIVISTKSRINQVITDSINAMKPDKVLHVGGAGYKTVLLLEGAADVYLYASKGTKKWDTCACEALVETIGGKLTDVFGNHMQYHKTVEHINEFGVLATMQNHDRYVSRIPISVRNTFSKI
ncbi:3'(2'),5'-bisphosphate nucleotidase 1 [Trichoplax sp. H2]|nr:3'(2'),5'-bisphosphate nucleotidase 1 [Trichoplax sp. H2]|eukprot:RDD47348.1 3'(2'),5'-bisphosphate nucleotidase 1 [Trichoplax sp. H2]